jgi:hypothetical protein
VSSLKMWTVALLPGAKSLPNKLMVAAWIQVPGVRLAPTSSGPVAFKFISMDLQELIWDLLYEITILCPVRVL